jgi:endonuclease/exonuclease/phosphatase (EEP) superfamily protein YafD
VGRAYVGGVTPRSRARLLAALLGLAACAPTINLLQPDAPRFEGRHAPPADTGGAGPIRVVSFNIKMSRRIDAALAVLDDRRLRGADVLSLQEMDERGVERIARALRLNYVYFPSVIHPAAGRHFGPALLTRWPIDSAWKVVLPHEGALRGQRRTATAATLRIRGVRVRVYAVHLENQTKLSAREYREQAAAVLADAARADDPVVIAGDFNGWDIGRFMEAMGYHWPTEDAGATSALFPLDHVFTRGLAPLQAGVVREVRGASDHRPVWATVALPAAFSGEARAASPP